MGLLSRFTQKEAAAAQAPAQTSAESKELWRKGNFLAVRGGEDLYLTCAGEGPPKGIPAFAVDFVLGCTKFDSLERHIARHARRHGWGSMEIASLQSWLPQVTASGLLISSEEVRRRCAAGAGNEDEPPKISSIGFPTGGNRVELTERALRSFAVNARTYRRDVEFVVADSSARTEQRAQYRKRLTALAEEMAAPIIYIGEDEKRAFIAALVRRGACSPGSADFALRDPLGIGFACGANRNALLLRGAGRMICSVDDDVICRLAAAPELVNGVGQNASRGGASLEKAGRRGLALFSTCDPFSRRLFANRESAMASASWIKEDFLGLHERMLGRQLGDLAAGVESDGKLDLAQAGDGILRRLELPGSRVRATFSGHVGDPGIPTSIYYLFYEGENRRRLTESEAHYRSVFASRSVQTMVAQPAVGDASVSPGMAMGLDHRELLPPFFPVLHAEDFIFGATLWQCCRGALLGHLPSAVTHEPPAGKHILLPKELNPDRRVVVMILVDRAQRWYLGPTIIGDEVEWTRQIGIGNPVPQPSDRFFTVCLNMVPADSIERLTVEMIARAGEGLAEEALPPDRVELACVPAVRPAGT